MGGLNTLLNYNAIRRFFNYSLDFKFLSKILVISLISYTLVYNYVSYIIVDPWVELISGGVLSILVYLLGFIVLKIFTKQDLVYLKKLASGFGPLTPVVNILVDFMMRFT